MEQVLGWLSKGPSWVQYRTRIDLLGQSEDNQYVKDARIAMLAEPQVTNLLSELRNWPGPALKRHNDASHPLHKLAFLADLGHRLGDPCIDEIVENIMARRSVEGPFQVILNIPIHFGGRGEDELAWMLCDAPLVVYSLIRFGLSKDRRVREATDFIASLIRENGWPCAATSRFGKFRGPGRREDPCPYATLIILRMLSQVPDLLKASECHVGTDTLLDLWDKRKERRPYLFAMGTYFSRFKAPLIWYDILHMLDVLTNFPWLCSDPRLQQMADMLRLKADSKGRFTAESVWKAWAEWEFGQKRQPSYWITFLAHRILSRLNGVP